MAQNLLLSLTESVKIGVGNSLSLLSEKIDRDEKKLDIEVAKKIFIPQAEVNLESVKILRKADFKSSISQKTKNGSTFGFEFAGKSYYGSDTKHNRSVVFSLQRPLLRNFGGRITGIDIDISKLDYEIALVLFRSELNSYISKIAKTFFDLYLSQKNLEIQKQALVRARQNYEDTMRDIVAGAIAEQEIFLLEENMVLFEIKEKKALRDIAWNNLELKRLLCLDTATSTVLIASDTFDDHLYETIEFAKSWDAFQHQNPEFQIKKLYFDKARLDHEKFRNLLRPVLDFKIEYEVDHLSIGGQSDQYQAGFLYQLPVDRKSEWAQVKKSQLSIRRSEVNIKEVELNYFYDLKKNLQDAEYQRDIIQSLEKVTNLSRKKMEAEQDKYRNGISTLADIVRFQRELENSTMDEVQALINLNRIRIQRFALEGILYQQFGIEIEP